jgi:hypothetical protein
MNHVQGDFAHRPHPCVHQYISLAVKGIPLRQELTNPAE